MSRSEFVGRILSALFITMVAGEVLADELTLTVQEQLKAQGAYSGLLDGKPSPELTKALKNYQQRHNLPASGVLDRATAKALDDEAGMALPEKSTTPPTKQKAPSPAGTPAPIATATHPPPPPAATPAPIATATPAPPAASAPPKPTSPPPIPIQSPPPPATTASATPNESPSPTETGSPAEVSPSPPAEGPLTNEPVTKFVRNFLDAAEGKSVATQLRFYSFPVNYLGHGKVNAKFVRNDILRTMRRWPRRNYQLKDDISVTPVSAETATAEFSVSYTLQKGKQRTNGRKSIRLTLRETKGNPKIVAIRERRE
jgi:peptidoglycan hydrolase-like protein with peptidoglycan-binding domain